MSIPTSTSLVQRIEAALSGNDLHSSEIAGLIAAAEAAAGRFEKLIAQLHLLLTALNAAEKQQQKSIMPFENEPIVERKQPQRGFLAEQAAEKSGPSPGLYFQNEPSRPSRSRSRYRSPSP